MKQFVIIGGGIIGTTIALELARRGAGPVTVLEKESSLGRHASGRNSGVIHSGINQKPGSLKARMCVEGSKRLREYCRKKNVPMNECGTLVAARRPEEIKVLERLLAMGRQSGVPGLEIIDERELKKREPRALGMAALLSPTGAAVDSRALLNSLAEDAHEEDVRFELARSVVRIDGHRILTSDGEWKADHIINSAGLHADKIAHSMGVGKEYQVVPFRGEYFEVKGCDVRSMIYQPPDLRFPFLSIHLTRETDGRVLAGPSAVLAFGREAYEKEWVWPEMIEMFRSPQFLRLVTSRAFLSMAFQNLKTSFSKRAFLKEVQSLVPGVREDELVPYRSGIRAQLVDRRGRLVDDLLVEFQEGSTHILNAVSPGMTSSLAFAEWVADRLTGRRPV
ncbi:MAG: L-2-hydroxyglutarate oxidase [Candidatus Omnitrophica bacterium]|nr:L-2-hydroxyglutarate oxidase [Candidatus Omnitrophota bacterium]